MIKEKVLVCIIIQENSKRLIDKAVNISQQLNGELHIVHIEKGMSIFSNPTSVIMLENLFNYGKIQGGEVHFISDDDIPKCMVRIIEEMAITRVVIGETMRSKIHQLLQKDINSYIRNANQAYEILVLNRKKNNEEKPKQLPNDFAY
jgi:K+-sensing histidine kinase KdpD